MRTVFVFSLFLLISSDAVGQHTMYAVSGQGQGNQENARQGAQISRLEAENADRKAETTQNASLIADHEARITANESELATIEPHAKAGQQSCAAGELIRWDGASYTCVSEDDTSVGEHSLTTTVPPDCHDTNAKLLWNASTKQWHCEMDMNDGSGGGWPGAEEDPEIGAMSNDRLCRTDGAQVICDNLAPGLVGNGIAITGDLEIGGIFVGNSATFSGNVSADAPTASNHIVTKAYVDAEFGL